MSEPQRRQNRNPHLDASVVPVERSEPKFVILAGLSKDS